MIQLSAASRPSDVHAVVARAGGRLDLSNPDAGAIRVKDIAQRLARTPADASAPLFYSLAQRSVLLADAIEAHWGALAAMYAMTHFAPLAYTGHVEAAAFNATHHMVLSGLQTVWTRLHEAICNALDLDHPVPTSTHGALLAQEHRVRASEICALEVGTREERTHYTERGERPLFGRLVTVCADKAERVYLERLSRLASEAHLRRGIAWEGVA